MAKTTPLVLAAVVTATCATMFPSAAYAQEHQGFWMGAGGGYGSAHPDCDGCDHAGRESSGVLYLKAGWTLTPRLLVGGELNVWKKDVRGIAPNVDAALRMSSLSATATVYPWAASRLFFKGGAGLAFVGSEFTIGQTSIAPSLGVGTGLLTGAGYDVRLTNRISLTPAVSFWFGRIGDLELDQQTFVADWKQNVIDVTIGVTLH